MRQSSVMMPPLLAACLATLLCGLLYAAVQQDLRQTANDPQVQMAEDAAARLAAGQAAAQTVPPGATDFGRSLASYLIVYDDANKPLASSGTLDGHVPTLPEGVYAELRAHGETRLTWQPRPGVRSAVVMARYGGTHPGFVLAGRSLREVEVREDALRSIVGVGWAISLALCLLAMLILWRQKAGAPKS